jgi:hypothetical protein
LHRLRKPQSNGASSAAAGAWNARLRAKIKSPANRSAEPVSLWRSCRLSRPAALYPGACDCPALATAQRLRRNQRARGDDISGRCERSEGEARD